MKKSGNFILSLIMPRKMAKFRNMHGLLAVLIYFVGMFMAIGSQFIMSEDFVKKDLPRYEYQDTLETIDNLPIATGLRFANMQTLLFSTDSSQSVDEEKGAAQITKDLLEESFKNYDNAKTLKVSIAFDYKFSYNSVDESKNKFTNGKLLTEYYKNIKENTENNEYLLYFFTKDGVYYVHNLDTSSNTLNDNLSIFKLFKDNFKSYEDGTIEKALENIRRIGKDKIDVNTFVKEMNNIISNHDSSFIISNNLNLQENTSNKGYYQYSVTYFENLGIYNKITKDTKTNGYLDVTVVIDPKFDLKSQNEADYNPYYFDYEGYFQQERRANTTYVLCLFSADRFFFVYDLGQKNDGGTYKDLDYSSGSIFLKTSGGNYKYFLPKDASELKYNMYGELDTTLWTKEVSKDDSINLNTFGETDLLTEEELLDLKAVTRHNTRFYDAIYTLNSRSYLYSDMIGDSFTEKTLSSTTYIDDLLQILTDTMIKIDASNYELSYGFMALCVIVLFPILMTLIIWLLSRKLMMKKFRQYYAIGSICYGMTSIISFILGFAFQFDKYILYVMLFQAWFFIFVTFRINTDPQYINPEDDDEIEKKKEEEKLEFKEVKEIKTSQIG